MKSEEVKLTLADWKCLKGIFDMHFLDYAVHYHERKRVVRIEEMLDKKIEELSITQ